MFVSGFSGLIVLGASASVCLLGGQLGNRVYSFGKSTAQHDKSLTTRGFWKRPLAIGLLLGALLVWKSDVPLQSLWAVVWLALGFIFAAIYVGGWLKLVTVYGPAAIEAGELSLVATLMLIVLLYVSGVLWTTLLVLGGCTLVAATVANGMWLYRLR